MLGKMSNSTSQVSTEQPLIMRHIIAQDGIRYIQLTDSTNIYTLPFKDLVKVRGNLDTELRNYLMKLIDSGILGQFTGVLNDEGKMIVTEQDGTQTIHPVLAIKDGQNLEVFKEFQHFQPIYDKLKVEEEIVTNFTGVIEVESKKCNDNNLRNRNLLYNIYHLLMDIEHPSLFLQYRDVISIFDKYNEEITDEKYRINSKYNFLLGVLASKAVDKERPLNHKTYLAILAHLTFQDEFAFDYDTSDDMLGGIFFTASNNDTEGVRGLQLNYAELDNQVYYIHGLDYEDLDPTENLANLLQHMEQVKNNSNTKDIDICTTMFQRNRMDKCTGALTNALHYGSFGLIFEGKCLLVGKDDLYSSCDEETGARFIPSYQLIKNQYLTQTEVLKSLDVYAPSWSECIIQPKKLVGYFCEGKEGEKALNLVKENNRALYDQFMSLNLVRFALPQED